MVKKPISGDSEQRERDSERSRRASQISSSTHEETHTKPRPYRGHETPSNGGPEGESAHGALPREGIESD
jgi:hypothetical protein